MSVVAFPSRSGPAGACTVPAAVDRYSDPSTATTRASYDDSLARLIDVAGGTAPVVGLLPEDFAAVMNRWNTAAAATRNRHLSALTSFTTWAQRQELWETNPDRRLTRRRPARRGDRAIPCAGLDRLFTGDGHGLRERVPWRMLYDTAGSRGSCYLSRSSAQTNSLGRSRGSTVTLLVVLRQTIDTFTDVPNLGGVECCKRPGQVCGRHGGVKPTLLAAPATAGRRHGHPPASSGAVPIGFQEERMSFTFCTLTPFRSPVSPGRWVASAVKISTSGCCPAASARSAYM
ncbi:hypothetical protein SAMN06265355_10176 [Actinomadura mexicana]|uniref:Core-binding (CB) domain-containing protein n=1 Tax=Actinomadura mexicana TaxID=134959 RepID=A0A238UN84_9ACTN|nr:hypothetical protein SAMN06265355_10176 [Actinomadura mexicana]